MPVAVSATGTTSAIGMSAIGVLSAIGDAGTADFERAMMSPGMDFGSTMMSTGMPGGAMTFAGMPDFESAVASAGMLDFESGMSGVRIFVWNPNLLVFLSVRLSTPSYQYLVSPRYASSIVKPAALALAMQLAVDFLLPASC